MRGAIASRRPYRARTVIRLIDQPYHHFVSPSASGSGTGSFGDPWTLGQFLAAPGGLGIGEVTALRCQPGNDLYEQAGSWTWSSSLNGSGGGPSEFDKKINLLAYKPDKGLPTISSSGTANETTLRIDGTHVRLQGIRIRKNNTIRSNGRGTALWLRGAYDNKPTGSGMLIHCYIEDGANGLFSGNSPADNFEGGDWVIYGCVLINNGEDDGPRNHNVYHRHQGAGRVQFIKNIIGMGLGNSLMNYEEAVGVDAITNIDLIENICFMSGVLGTATGNWWNMEMGGGGAGDGPARNCTMRGNILFHPDNAAETAQMQLGSAMATNEHLVVEDNHIYRGQQDDIVRVQTFRTDGNPTLVFRRNHIYRGSERAVTFLQSGSLSAFTWEQNKYYSPDAAGATLFVHGGVQRTLASLIANAGIGSTDEELAEPTASQVFVIPVNAYEPGRAHVFTVKWAGTDQFTQCNLDSVLSTGDRFRVMRAQNPHVPIFGPFDEPGGTEFYYTQGQTFNHHFGIDDAIQAPIGTCPRTAPALSSGTLQAECLIVERTN